MGINVLHFDTEVRSALDLKKCGAHVWLEHPSAAVLCLAYAVNDGPVTTWMPGQPVPEPFAAAASQEAWTVVAHNAGFDHLVLQQLLARQHGFPAIPIEKFRCTAAMVRALGLPGGLGMAAAALDMPEEFRKGDDRIMREMAKPRRTRKADAPNVIYFHDDVGREERLNQYCHRDTEAERALWGELRNRQLSDHEQAIWLLDHRINARGFAVDISLAHCCQTIAAQVADGIDAQLAAATNGAVTKITQCARLKAWVAEQGVQTDSLDKETLVTLLVQNLPPAVHRVLELRQLGAQAAAAKVNAFLSHCSDDGRVRGAFIYHGAHTGRWTSMGVQAQNLKRFEADNLEDIIAAVRTRELDKVHAVYNRPLEAIGGLSRSLIIAGPGKQLLGADFSAIESRVLAWLAGEEWKLAAYRKFDRTKDPADEVYSVLGCQMLAKPIGSVTGKKDPIRVIGKTADLACGYQGWAPAIERFAPGMWPEEKRKEIASQWREQHPRIVAFWKRLQDAWWDAVAGRATVECGPVTFVMKQSGMWLRIRLPNGRYLFYPMPKNYYVDRHKMGLAYGKYLGGWQQIDTYGGKLAENITQAVSRDILAEAMLRLDAAGFDIVAHVHDEILCEVPEEFDRLDEFKAIMTQPPTWALDLPIAAEAWLGQRFR